MSHVSTIGRLLLTSLAARRKPRTFAAVVWAHFVAQPGFRAETRQALQDLAAGRAVPLKEISRDR